MPHTPVLTCCSAIERTNGSVELSCSAARDQHATHRLQPIPAQGSSNRQLVHLSPVLCCLEHRKDRAARLGCDYSQSRHGDAGRLNEGGDPGTHCDEQGRVLKCQGQQLLSPNLAIARYPETEEQARRGDAIE